MNTDNITGMWLMPGEPIFSRSSERLMSASETPKGNSHRGFPEVNLAGDGIRRRSLDALLQGAGLGMAMP